MKTYLLLLLFWVSHAWANSYMLPPIFIQTDTETQVLEAVLEKYDSITKALTETLPDNSKFQLELDYDADLKIYTYTITGHPEITEEQLTRINQLVSRHAIDLALTRVDAISKDLEQIGTKQPDKNPSRDELVQKILRRRLQNCNYYSGYSWLLKIKPKERG